MAPLKDNDDVQAIVNDILNEALEKKDTIINVVSKLMLVKREFPSVAVLKCVFTYCINPSPEWKHLFDKESQDKLLKVGGAALGTGCITAVAAPVGLGALGFSSAGITAGSIAAGAQGPAVAAGSWFATLQSMGATGFLLSTTGIMATLGAGALVGGAVAGTYYAVQHANNKRRRELVDNLFKIAGRFPEEDETLNIFLDISQSFSPP